MSVDTSLQLSVVAAARRAETIDASYGQGLLSRADIPKSIFSFSCNFGSGFRKAATRRAEHPAAVAGEAAVTPLSYAATGRRVFPLADKRTPLIAWGAGATTNPQIIANWWTRWPGALIGAVTGEVDCVLDVDPPEGFATLAALGVRPEQFETPAAVTPRGWHFHFGIPASGPFPGTAGNQGCGIGLNLDWRCAANYIVMPSPGSGYDWEPNHTPDLPLAEVPPQLLPKKPEASESRFNAGVRRGPRPEGPR